MSFTTSQPRRGGADRAPKSVAAAAVLAALDHFEPAVASRPAPARAAAAAVPAGSASLGGDHAVGGVKRKRPHHHAAEPARAAAAVEDEEAEVSPPRTLAAAPAGAAAGVAVATAAAASAPGDAGVPLPPGVVTSVHRLLEAGDARFRGTRRGLPMAKHASDLVRSVACNAVTVLVGETGSGKTTQVPQYLWASGLLHHLARRAPRRWRPLLLAAAAARLERTSSSRSSTAAGTCPTSSW